MKIQHLAIIFILIILPISLVMGEYIQSQIDTISLQTMYSQKLQDATYDSLRAFQINTINNKYSSLSDSKIRDIEAAITTFYDSIATSFGGDNSIDSVREYVPAMVFTMYDGYYIYGKYFDYEKNQYQYGLKPYIYYSCRYVNGLTDVIINYTLDNSLTVYGKINGEYQTRSGYVLSGTITYSEADAINKYGQKFYKKVMYNGIPIEAEVLTENVIVVNEEGNVEKKKLQYTKYGNQKIYKDGNQYFTCSNNRKQVLSDEGKFLQDNEITPLRYAQTMTWGDNLHSNSAVQYYIEAKQFTDWVRRNLGAIRQKHVVDNNGKRISENNKIEGTEQEYFSANIGNRPIFEFGDSNNPLISGSTFNEHRMAVIRKSIETNLQSAIANYNEGSSGTHMFQMPIFNDEDWDKLLNNVSLSVFMQGIPIKVKTFNSYCIVTNDSNEEVVTEDSIYIVAKNNTTGRTEVHSAGCKDLLKGSHTIIGGYNTTDFKLQTVALSEGNENYYYPQLGDASNIVTYCYDCIVNISDTYDTDDIISGVLKEENNRSIKDTSLRRIYLTALARERYDLYRTNKSL